MPPRKQRGQRRSSVPTETILREAIAARPSVLEPGLALVDSEMHLRNTRGAAGFVDVVARDRYGTLTLIEIKRDDNPARQAIHELFKYVALVRSSYGLGPDRVRCIIASTTWHELLVPFSEFVRAVPYSVTGSHISLNAKGRIVSVAHVAPMEEAATLDFSPFHLLNLYANSAERDRCRGATAELLEERALDFLLIDVEYGGDAESVIFRHGFLLVVACIPESRHRELQRSMRLGVSQADAGPRGTTGWKFRFEQAVLTYISERVEADEVGALDCARTTDLLREWRMVMLRRFGARLQSPAILPDEQLMTSVKGLDGGNPITFMRIGTPRLKAGWAALTAGLHEGLSLARSWQRTAILVLQEAGRATTTETVGVHAYIPHDLLGHLVFAMLQCDPNSYLPSVDIVVISTETPVSRLLRGELRWNGKTRPKNAATLLSRVYSSKDGAMTHLIARTLGESSAFFASTVSKLGFVLAFAEYALEGDKWRQLGWIEPGRSRPKRIEVDRARHFGMNDWLRVNRGFARDLVRLLTANTNLAIP